MSLVPMGGHKIAPNPTLVDSYPDVYLTHRPGGREPRARSTASPARSRTRSRCAAISARSRRSTRAIRRRNRRRAAVGARNDDEGPRRDTSIEALAKLRPAFHVKGRSRRATRRRRATAPRRCGDDGRPRARARARAAGPLRRVRDRRRRAGTFGIGPVPAIRKVLEDRRADARRDRSRRAERGVRRAGARLPARTADRSRSPRSARRDPCRRA